MAADLTGRTGTPLRANISTNRISLPQGLILLVEILATNKSALCRSASLAFSFVFSRSSDA